MFKLFQKKVPTISVAQLQQALDAEESIVLVDVRSPEEIKSGKITPGAKEINFYDFDFQKKILNIPKDQTYVVYCASGGRSGKAVEIMRKSGYKNVKNLVGGYTAYKNTKK